MYEQNDIIQNDIIQKWEAVKIPNLCQCLALLKILNIVQCLVGPFSVDTIFYCLPEETVKLHKQWQNVCASHRQRFICLNIFRYYTLL